MLKLILLLAIVSSGYSGGVRRRCGPCSRLVGSTTSNEWELVSVCKAPQQDLEDECPRGVVRDGCDCCDVCAKDVGEACSGEWNQYAYGRCAHDLACHIEPQVSGGQSLGRLGGRCQLP